ncbi:lysozyme inhibitor LprI family protein [Paracidobacterium acidisoli]|uniref:DUF1311 domain-containing protein n=1 Tax=Paracidobacterium acidisoli TaxID=2303751 RepID=A0A372IPJ2_9BACT|nr:lysozyme inhibitor LprI family protein [Paracidobacterium acidisoli]MBT9331135.1 DUF1311 domain-containing protein [Paracidobacterium acidisoli]
MAFMQIGHTLRFFLLSSLACLLTGNILAQHMNAAGNPCQSIGPDSSETQCFITASQAADRELNSFYGKLRAHLRSDDLSNLQAAQRLWMQFRDANCKAEYDLYEGGSAGPMVRAACIEAVTRQRTAELKTIYGWVLEK